LTPASFASSIATVVVLLAISDLLYIEMSYRIIWLLATFGYREGQNVTRCAATPTPSA
jgi:hypothetical protein